MSGSLQDRDTLTEESETEITREKCTSRLHKFLFNWVTGNKQYNDGLIKYLQSNYPSALAKFLALYANNFWSYSPIK